MSHNDPILIGRTIANRWEIVELLEEDKLFTIYKATEITSGKIVSLKLMQKHLAAAVPDMQHLAQQARSLVALHHEHISNFYDVLLTASNELFLLCDYLNAESLEDILGKSGHTAIDMAVRIFQQCTEALEYAHLQKILHHDLKPSNIKLVSDQFGVEDVKIVDFGISHLIAIESEQKLGTSHYLSGATRELIGNAFYTSPEQFGNRKVDQRSDIYALGCIMYEAISGKPPLVGKSLMETAYRHLNEMVSQIPNSGKIDQAAARFEAIVIRMLKKDPDERYQSMSEVKHDLSLVLESTSEQWQSSSLALQKLSDKTTPIRPKWSGFRLRVVLISAVTIVLFAIAALFTVVFFRTSSNNTVQFDNRKLWTIQKNKLPEPTHKFLSQRESTRIELESVEQEKSKNSSEYTQTLFKLSQFDLQTGRWAEAEKELKQLLDIQKQMGPSVPLADIYSNLAVCYFMQSKNAEAATTCDLVWQIASKPSNCKIQSLLKALNIACDIYTQQGNIPEAKEWCLRLYQVAKSQKATYPAAYAVACARLADVYRQTQDFNQAESYYKEALDWWRNYVSHHDLFVIKALYGYGLVLMEKKEYARAHQCFEEDLPIATALLDANSPLVASLRTQNMEALFHCDFYKWLTLKINPEEVKQRSVFTHRHRTIRRISRVSVR